MTTHQLDLTTSPLILTEPFVVCPLCGNGAGSGLGLLDGFFHGKALVCDACGRTSDAWHAYVATINHPVSFLHDTAAFFVGFKTAVFNFFLSPGQITELNFGNYGVAPGSRLIRLNYTPQGKGVLPVELHGNDAIIRRARDQVNIYGLPMTGADAFAGDCAAMAPVLVAVTATFAEPNDVNEQAEDALGRAFLALKQNEFIEMVIPATMAVEFTCKRLIKDFEDAIGAPQDGVKDKDLLTTEVPKIAAAVGALPLSAEICGKVQRLWGQRDAVAHSGRLYQPYTRENAGIQMASAVFAFRYMAMLRRFGVEQGLVG